jgi:serine/threonine protein kinase
MPARVVTESDLQAALGPFDELVPIGARSGSGEAWRARKGSDVLGVKVVVHEHQPGRFSREVAALKRITSPRVMRIIDDGTIPVGGTDYPYIVSEYVEGQNVRDQLAGGAPDDAELREFLVQLLRGLEEFKDVEIVHRDLKPENIICRDSRWTEPVIIDLGLSRLIDASTPLTVYPWLGGTWQYMAPEQLRGERAYHKTDMWAVGVIAAELAAGHHPFYRPGETPLPPDWDDRLRAGISVPGSRPAGCAARPGRRGR